MKGQMPKMGLRVRAEAVVLGAVLVGALALGGCSIGPFGAPPSASTILKRAAAIQITSEEYTNTTSVIFLGTNTSTSFDVKFTANPKRTDIAFALRLITANTTGELINDAATNTVYEKVTLPLAHGGKWFTSDKYNIVQTASDIGPFVDFKGMQDVKLVGSATVNGVAVWHLSRVGRDDVGTFTENIYLAQSDYRPVKIVVTRADTQSAHNNTTTIVFKAINDSSISIALPPADQIASA